ncbi:MAG: peroxiredoxin [Candidatus Omnitrophota bacterium]|nr:MAG: peroxiredoxin [Candidatus Omnitrophota bacterium]
MVLQKEDENKVLQIGKPAPDFKVEALVGKEFKEIRLSDYKGKKWVCLFFYPLDFTFVCPTEIIEFSNRGKEFAERNCQVLGASTDSKFSHLGWCSSHPGLKDLKIPLLADYKKQIACDYGILKEDLGAAFRGTFLIDPDGNLRFIYITDLSVGRNVDEVLRVLDALQTGELTPCQWKKGDAPLKV